MSDVLSVGVIGAGTIAHGHMRAIQANDIEEALKHFNRALG